MPDRTYNLKQIAVAVGLPAERVRYVIDQGLLPGARGGRVPASSGTGRGNPRTYTQFEAFGVACAAAMISAGLRRKTVRECLKVLCIEDQPGRKHQQNVPLWQAFESRDTAILEIGDQLNVRMYGSADYRGQLLDVGWRQIGTGAPVSQYEPLVVVGINVARIRKLLQSQHA